MPFGPVGFWEVLLVLLVLLLVFGARRLPELGGSLGKGIREFRKSVSELGGQRSKPEDEAPKELNQGGDDSSRGE